MKMNSICLIILLLISCTGYGQPILSGFYPFQYGQQQQQPQQQQQVQQFQQPPTQQPQLQNIQTIQPYHQVDQQQSVPHTPANPPSLNFAASIPYPSQAGLTGAGQTGTARADNAFAFGYQTPDGQLRTESVKADGTTTGTYAYRLPDGQFITINYSAGKNSLNPATGAPTSAATPAAANSGVLPDATASQFQQPQQSQSPTYLVVNPSTSGVPSYYPFNQVANQPTAVSNYQPQYLTQQTQPQFVADPNQQVVYQAVDQQQLALPNNVYGGAVGGYSGTPTQSLYQRLLLLR
ncbi:hypothetical protein CHUAL_008403 [Chamberlinius hualienensis]